ncbi:host cell division inhibitor Icd-like protein [Escherichia coli O21:H21]
MLQDKNMLIASSFGLYDAGVAHMANGFSSLNNTADSRLHSDMRFFYVRKPTHTRIMAGRDGGAFALAGSCSASLLTPLRLATTFSSVVARLLNFTTGAFHMAVSARPYFIWRFMRCQEKQTSLFTVTAATEREARAQLPHVHLIFVARIRQGVSHA